MQTSKWTIGEVEIYQIIELEIGPIIQSLLKEATPEKIKTLDWLIPNFADQDGNLKALVQSFLIRSNGKNILIDTCIGNGKVRTDLPEWGNLQTNFLNKLEATGIKVSEIDTVACTHMHFDHVGWNTRFINDKWMPTFANAKYLFAKEEYNYWINKPTRELSDDHAGFSDSVIPIMEADLAQLVDNNYRIDSNVSLIPTPGHTPGHVSILIESKGKSALISGDFLYHPCQIAFPDWSTEADTDQALTVETRYKILSQLAENNTLLIGSHFSEPVIGQVKKEDQKFVFLS